MHLFPQTMLEVWKLYGDACLGAEVQPEHVYHWRTVVDGEVVVDEDFSIATFLCPQAIPGLWPTYDLVVLLAILDCELSVDPDRDFDALYVGAGSGRFADACAALATPRAVYSIDFDESSIELMGLRGVPCELADGHAMPFADDAYPLVVLAPWSLDSSTDPEALIAEAARVSSERVIVSGWLADPDDEAPKTYAETMTTHDGRTHDRVGTARHHNAVLAMFDAVGMSPIIARTFIPSDDEPGDASWLIEVGHL